MRRLNTCKELGMVSYTCIYRLRRLRQEEHEFEVSLGYRVRLCKCHK